MADSAVASPRLLPSALTEFDSGSQQVSDNETQDHDEADLDLVLSNILASRRNPNLGSEATDDEQDELVDESNLSSSSSEAESTTHDEDSSDDDRPLANRNNRNTIRRRRVVPRRRIVREPHVSCLCNMSRKFTLNTSFSCL